MGRNLPRVFILPRKHLLHIITIIHTGRYAVKILHKDEILGICTKISQLNVCQENSLYHGGAKVRAWLVAKFGPMLKWS